MTLSGMHGIPQKVYLETDKPNIAQVCVAWEFCKSVADVLKDPLLSTDLQN